TVVLSQRLHQRQAAFLKQIVRVAVHPALLRRRAGAAHLQVDQRKMPLPRRPLAIRDGAIERDDAAATRTAVRIMPAHGHRTYSQHTVQIKMASTTKQIWNQSGPLFWNLHQPSLRPSVTNASRRLIARSKSRRGDSRRRG